MSNVVGPMVRPVAPQISMPTPAPAPVAAPAPRLNLQALMQGVRQRMFGGGSVLPPSIHNIGAGAPAPAFNRGGLGLNSGGMPGGVSPSPGFNSPLASVGGPPPLKTFNPFSG